MRFIIHVQSDKHPRQEFITEMSQMKQDSLSHPSPEPFVCNLQLMPAIWWPVCKLLLPVSSQNKKTVRNFRI